MTADAVTAHRDAPSPAASREADAMLRLGMVDGLGPVRIRALVQVFGSARATLQATSADLAGVPRVGAHLAPAIVAARRMDTRSVWDRARRVGASAILPGDERYPAALREIFDPPSLVWVRGTPPPAGARLVAVVGTRRATPYGREAARAAAAELARAGIGVVSGLALGIDGQAHRGALEEGGFTAAVLGCGIDRIYPSAHRALARSVVASGCLISELLPGTPSAAGHFPRRNRIISGMCRAVLVVEAYERGGALITARLALDQNREVFALPGPVSSAASRGAHALVREGTAELVVDVAGMIRSLWPDVAPTPERRPEVTAMEGRLLGAIPPTGTPFERVCEATGVEVSTALAVLLDLEFRGFVRQLAGRQFLRTALADRVCPWNA